MINFNPTPIIVFLLLIFYAIGFSSDHSAIHNIIEKMHRNSQASWSIECEEDHIYIDPLLLPADSPIAKIIFITHSHSDHLSIADIRSISDKNTILIGPKSCKMELTATGLKNIHLISPEEEFSIAGISVKAVPAYNIRKTQFHPKENNWVGYIIDINGVKIYHAGDTERIPEMKNFDCDIALLPLGQTYTMDTVEEATEAAIDINPIVAIPMHYGMYEGNEEDAIKFKNLLKGKIEVIIKGDL